MKSLKSVRSVCSVLALAFLPFLAGCDDCIDDDCCHDGWYGDHIAPVRPAGVRSTTGDGRVTLTWLESRDEDVRGYRVYVSRRAEGPYDELGDTRQPRFVDYGARNGHTYFYAVAAYDGCGNESELSYEDVFDTPRPEGRNLTLRSASHRPWESGYDFSEFTIQAPEDPGTDIYFQGSGPDGACMHAVSTRTRIQDMGYMPMVDLDWAPDGGWSPAGRVELIPGHTYAVLTADGFYAKFHVASLSSDRAVVDWAVQLDRGNRELSVQPPVTAGETPRGPTGGRIPPPSRTSPAPGAVVATVSS